ncbi:carboxypeptidase-like regulatory domain-containing protein [Mucilaginibacter daejeonensis]|uniref:carboxypeptidase-like regulatory domain-containing protein n=1 Tax=Mucilaginibacter daejeonensis TaxID=398049 RepID=UPI001D1725D6|nr:carboxypeptidase-like regulatory domain-containing protein [Mucilaginibacter daejeonensis]UEG54242.1 carboxypeptidase-like regulatory domain-containing protein [Mucilaginibacter daejeonensis]
MKLKNIIMICLLAIGFSANAQQGTIRGQVVESGTNNKMFEVFVRNTNNNQVSLSDENGNFQIRGSVGNTLILSSAGYVSDTLYVTDLNVKTITMTQMGIALRAVNVKGERFNPRTEYPQVYQKSKVYVLSPTSWFSKEAKDARRLKNYFAREEKERVIDSVFTKAYVSSIVPLKGVDLDNFMSMYRPTFEFVKSNNGETMAAYINDSYKKYRALPADKRVMPKLNAEPVKQP